MPHKIWVKNKLLRVGTEADFELYRIECIPKMKILLKFLAERTSLAPFLKRSCGTCHSVVPQLKWHAPPVRRDTPKSGPKRSLKRSWLTSETLLGEIIGGQSNHFQCNQMKFSSGINFPSIAQRTRHSKAMSRSL